METKNWINGEWVTPKNEKVEAYNPGKLSEKVGIVNFSDSSDVKKADIAANSAHKEWKNLNPNVRGSYLSKLADIFEENLDELAELASREMGKPIGEMKGEVNRGVNLFRYYAAEGMRSDGNIIPSSDTEVLQYSQRIPLGVVGIITPWNFPVAIPIWKMAPALICGNTVIWKPAENSVLTATKMAELFEKANLPKGVINLLIGRGRDIGNKILEEANIQCVSFTGSKEVGKHVAEVCARRNIKYQTEKGGKNAAIVMKDANLDKVVPIILSGAFRSAGQKCTATERIIVEKEVFDLLKAKLKEEVTKIKLGYQLEGDTYLGPVVSEDQYKKVTSFVNLAKEDAEVVAEGNNNVNLEGYYVNPLIVTGLDKDHSLLKDEVFGPLSVIVPVSDYKEAIQLCNDSEFGLSASIFTNDLNKAHAFLNEVEVGMARVNQETAGVEYQAPFGGLKNSSSHTREQGQAALDFYSEIKTCAIKYSL
ncbi:aldehyde dehydrogenase family protein [Aquisalibacillus elongatus]|uniref:Aldehyde dehydrogenase (NAD+) n=1 Tax=Aquisalibacillus elongatus TaxID=485577 RepID=A0A3N5B9N7_9BACI|nr:aldehyde dehydrogenase family protein [Aquisalibacillus elongatus]RPF52180.1 aldehyde dehydrogenase (NAD+) [Aquisalibacillus elongatus]